MVLLEVRRRGGSDLHWLVVRFLGERPVVTAGRSRSSDPSPPPLQSNKKQNKVYNYLSVLLFFYCMELNTLMTKHTTL